MLVIEFLRTRSRLENCHDGPFVKVSFLTFPKKPFSNGKDPQDPLPSHPATMIRFFILIIVPLLLTGRAQAKPLLKAGKPVLVLGDFNCNSPLDHRWLKARTKEVKTSDEQTAKRRAANADANSARIPREKEANLIPDHYPSKRFLKGRWL
jgi:hypothetical protein